MFQMLVNVLVACAMTGSVLSDATPAPATGTQPLILPEDNGRITYRQASREDILRRAEARRVAPRAGALQPRQSATVYPTCSSGSPGYIPESGFVSFPEYSINTNSGNLLVSQTLRPLYMSLIIETGQLLCICRLPNRLRYALRDYLW
jgi:hypothetical protein